MKKWREFYHQAASPSLRRHYLCHPSVLGLQRIPVMLIFIFKQSKEERFLSDYFSIYGHGFYPLLFDHHLRIPVVFES